jgi:D-alanine-D-alanine ligase
MVSKALRAIGHRVILLDVFMGYDEKEVEVSPLFETAEAVSIQVGKISGQAPNLKAVKAGRADQSPNLFGPNVIALAKKADIVFLALHGEYGEDGKIQATFDAFGIKYTGTGFLSSAMAMNKEISKTFFRANQIPTPAGIAANRANDNVANQAAGLTFPLIVKPQCGGSSIGVTVVQSSDEIQSALEEAFRWEENILIEEFVKGREFSVGVINGRALPIIEIAPMEGFYDYKNKYQAGSAVETCPANLSKEITMEMQGYAVKAAEVLGITTYSRVDFMLSGANEIYCLEVNTLPGMTPTSLLPQEAQAEGVNFESLCDYLVRISMEKYEDTP